MVAIPVPVIVKWSDGSVGIKLSTKNHTPRLGSGGCRVQWSSYFLGTKVDMHSCTRVLHIDLVPLELACDMRAIHTRRRGTRIIHVLDNVQSRNAPRNNCAWAGSRSQSLMYLSTGYL